MDYFGQRTHPNNVDLDSERERVVDTYGCSKSRAGANKLETS